MRGDGNKVIEHCRKIPHGPLHILTIHNDTVLHMATYSKQKQLVLELLQLLPDKDRKMIMAENDIGNTILHEAATCNRIVLAAKEMLRKTPELLRKKNKRGETALFRAARYGKMEMFKFLDDEVNRVCENERIEKTEGCREFYQRDDNTTILHISILTEHFDLALYIAQEHECLVSARDEAGLTALQLLSCNPSAFENGSKSYLKRLIKSCVSTEEASTTEEGESCFKVPLWEAIRGKNQKYQSAVRLAKFLIETDTSWEATETVLNTSISKTHKYRVASISSVQSVGKEHKTEASHATNKPNTAETALFLATKSARTTASNTTVGKKPTRGKPTGNRGEKQHKLEETPARVTHSRKRTKTEEPKQSPRQQHEPKQGSSMHQQTVEREPKQKQQSLRKNSKGTAGFQKAAAESVKKKRN
ncbi:hypothetical protein ACSBR1_016499 [Camellia fascicularis]